MAVKRNLLPESPTYYEVRGLKLTGSRLAPWKTTSCVFHGGSDSMRIHESGAWRCMACGQKGGDVLAYEIASTGADRVTAAKAIGAWVDDKTPFGLQKSTAWWEGAFSRAPTLAQREQHVAELKRAKNHAAAAQAVQWSVAAVKNELMWAQALPIQAGDPVAWYLAGRGIHLDTWPQALRFHPGLDYWHEGQYIQRLSVMLGAITDPEGRLVSLHRTYLSHDGRKADVPVVKKLTPRSAPLAGCSIKLHQPVSVQGAHLIGVAEGIETALACFEASGTPTVCAVSAQGMERYEWPGEVKSLIVYADNDFHQVGQKAAAALAHRAEKAGLAVRVLTPPHTGTDWADVWATREESC